MICIGDIRLGVHDVINSRSDSQEQRKYLICTNDKYRGQCPLITNVATTNDTFLNQMIQNAIAYGLIIIFAIVVYTAIIFLIGYKFGTQNIQRKEPIRNTMAEKNTMTPVTYSFIRGVKEPRFEFRPQIGGCWCIL